MSCTPQIHTPDGRGGAVAVQDEGAAVASTRTLNFEGAGVAVAHDTINNRITITISGGGGGGTGDVVGPVVSTSDNLVLFDGTTGKLIKDGGVSIANVRDRSTHTGVQLSSTISDFVEAVQDVVGVFIGGGSGISAVYDDVANTLTLSLASHTHATTDITGFAEAVEDLIGTKLAGGANISISYDDPTGITTISATGIGTGDVVGPTGATTDRLVLFDGTTGKLIKDGGATLADVRDRATHTGTQPSSTISDLQETVEDLIGTKLAGGSNISISYDDPTGITTISATGVGTGDVVGPTGATTDRLALFDGTTGKLIKDGGATLADVRDRATHTGTQLSTTISDFVEAVQDVAGSTLGAGSGIGVVYNDVAGTITISLLTHLHTSSEITDFQEAVEDLIGSKIAAGSNISVSYNDTTGITTIGLAIAITSTSPADGDVLVWSTTDSAYKNQSIGLAAYYFVDAYILVASGSGGTKVRNGIQNALDAATLYTGRGGKLVFSNAEYDMTGAPLQQTAGANCVLLVSSPAVVTTNPILLVQLEGPVRPTLGYSVLHESPDYNKSVPSTAGTVLRYDTAGSGTEPAIIGCDQTNEGYGPSSTWGNWTWLHIDFKNITVRSSNGATVGGVDMRYAAKVSVSGMVVDVGTSCDSLTDPSLASSKCYGFRTPRDGNGAWTTIDDLSVLGFYRGIEIHEQTQIKTATVMYCTKGLTFVCPQSHGSVVEKVLIQWCPTLVEATGSGSAHVSIERLDFETYFTSYAIPGAWYQHVWMFDDASNLLHGNCRFNAGDSVLNGAVTFMTTNGAKLFCIDRVDRNFFRYGVDSTVQVGNAFEAWTSASQIDGGGYRQSSPAVNDAVLVQPWLQQGLWEITMVGRTSPNGATIKVRDQANSVDVATGIDWYDAATNYNQVKTAVFPALATGYQNIRFVVTGLGGSGSGGHYLELTRVFFRRIG